MDLQAIIKEHGDGVVAFGPSTTEGGLGFFNGDRHQLFVEQCDDEKREQLLNALNEHFYNKGSMELNKRDLREVKVGEGQGVGVVISYDLDDFGFGLTKPPTPEAPDIGLPEAEYKAAMGVFTAQREAYAIALENNYEKPAQERMLEYFREVSGRPDLQFSSVNAKDDHWGCDIISELPQEGFTPTAIAGLTNTNDTKEIS